MLTDIEREQDWPAALAASWLAADSGTHCHTAFMVRGGLAAVLHHQATPPAYDRATLLDPLDWQRGLPHVPAGAGENRRGMTTVMVHPLAEPGCTSSWPTSGRERRR